MMLKFGRIAVVSAVALILAAGAIPARAEGAKLLAPRPVVRHAPPPPQLCCVYGGGYGGYGAGYGGGYGRGYYGY